METLNAVHLGDGLRKMLDRPQEIQTGYFGPGIWIRIRIQHRFRTRVPEWLLAFITALWGVVALLPGHMFDQPAFAGFKAVFGSEILLGLGMVFLGVARIVELIVNGARKNVTPHIRMISAAFGCLIFFGISYCYVLSGIVSPWLAIYPPFVLCELINIYRAAHDVGESYGHRTH